MGRIKKLKIPFTIGYSLAILAWFMFASIQGIEMLGMSKANDSWKPHYHQGGYGAGKFISHHK